MHKRSIAVVGLGYVGLPVAVAFGRVAQTVGFDIDDVRLAELSMGHDRTGECSKQALERADIRLTGNPADLTDADFVIITVPTPIDSAKNPDFGPLDSASRFVGEHLTAGDIVVYESTVYPGATEERCVPILAETSGLQCGLDFYVGYSPERINPGDHEHRLENIVKVVSGQDQETLDIVATVYESIISAGVYRAPSIKVAEAAKVIENTQRDLNIALMNELSVIFERMNIDTQDVLEAARTKWNFLPFTPGLVGGHCIGVDPYYLTHKATLLGYHPQVILAGRRINDSMGEFVASQAVKRLIRLGTPIQDQVVTVLGLTFKENVPDLRNTRVVDIVNELTAFGLRVQLHDPVASAEDIAREYGVKPTSLEDFEVSRCVVLAVPHHQYVENGWEFVSSLLPSMGSVVVDVKSALSPLGRPEHVDLWRL